MCVCVCACVCVRACTHVHVCVCVPGVCEHMRIDLGGEILDSAGVFDLAGAPPK